MSRLFLFAVLLAGIFVSESTRADEFDDLRLKWRNSLLGWPYDTGDPEVVSRLASLASNAQSYWDSMDTSENRTYLWSNAASTTISSHLTTTYSRLQRMALAYASPGCSLEGNPELLEDLIGGLDWMYAHRYNETTSIYDNWFQFEIGVPLQLNDIAVLIHDQLDSTRLGQYMGTIEKFTPSATTPAAGGTSGTFTGANRMWKIRVVAVRGALVRDPAKLVAARDAFSQLFQYVESGDGFYTDGSFLQHGDHPYTAGYGSSLLSNLAPVMGWLAGSTWEVVDPDRENLFRWVFDSFEPIVYRGATFDLVRGREMGREGATPQASGHGIMNSLLQIAEFAGDEDAARMKSLIKEWALSDTERDFLSGRGLSTYALAKSLLEDVSIPRRGELVGHYSFARMDRVIHLGPGYGFGLSMCSSRIANFESINGENLQGWFTGDGVTTLYNADLNQFSDAYWATIDPYRLPGVTADVTLSKLPHQSASIGPRARGQSTRSPHDWVGGVALGDHGAAGMEFKGVGVSLTGRKSWFMFDDEVVCLGAGITSTDGRPIETTVENRKLTSNGMDQLIVDGVIQSAALGWNESLPDVGWAHLRGPISGSDIGYYFPGRATIRGVREARTGAWSDIHDGRSPDPITRNYLRLGFEHGVDPDDARYSYVLLPGRNRRQMGTYAASPQVEVLANTPEVQAAREQTLGITAANFWIDGEQTVGAITVNARSSVMVRDDGTFVDVAVSDPTQLREGTIELTVDQDGGLLVFADPRIQVLEVTPRIRLSVDVTDGVGQTFSARFFRGETETVVLDAVADSYVYDSDSGADSNYGEVTTLVVKKSGPGYNRESYLRFDVPEVGGTLLGASLGLTCLSASEPGNHEVLKVDDNGWIESGEGGLTWNNRPLASGEARATWFPVVGEEVKLEVRGAVSGAGPLSLLVRGAEQTSNGYVTYASRSHSTASKRPSLSLLVGQVPPLVKLVQPADGDFLSRVGEVLLVAEVEDRGSGIVAVDFIKDGQLVGSDTEAPYEFLLALEGGVRELSAVVRADNGLSSSSLISRIEVARTPVAEGGYVQTPIGESLEIDLLGRVMDGDTDSSDLLFQLGDSRNGTAVLLEDGHTVRFMPGMGFAGVAEFDFTVTDTSSDPRLVLLYDFRDDSLSDRSGFGRDASLNIQGDGSYSFVAEAPGPFAGFGQRSLRLMDNGTSGAVRMERSLGLDVLNLATEDWTVAGWFRRDSAANRDAIVQFGNSGGYASDALTLAFYGTSETLNLRNYDGSVQDVSLGRSNVGTGVWHHFAIVREGGRLDWYLDGELAGTDSDFHLAFDNGDPVKFGGVSEGFLDRWLNGHLTDLVMFSGALDAGEVGRLRQWPARWFAGQIGTSTMRVGVGTLFEQWAASAAPSQSVMDPDVDTDGDGISNWEEYLLGSDPEVKDAGTDFVVSRTGEGVVLQIRLPDASGVGYEGLERRMDLLHSSSGVSGPWSPVDGWTDLPVQAGGIDFPVVLEGNSGFYRLRVRLQ